MGQRIRIINIGGNLVTILPVKVTEHIFIALLTCTQHHKLNVILTQFIHHIGYQIKPLLIRQPGDKTYHHLFIILTKSQLLLQSTLVFHLFLSEIYGIVILYNIFIRLGIEFIIINTVDNSSQVPASCPKQPIQSLTVKRSLNLLRISIAYGGYRIRIDDTSLQQIGILVCFQLIRCKIILRQSGNITNGFGIPFPLEFQIMYRDYRFHSAEKLSLTESLLHINRNQTGLPVMTMNHIRLKTDYRKSGKNRFGKICISLYFPDGRITVNLGPAKIVFIINKVIMNTVHFRLQDSHINPFPVEIHVEMIDILHLILHFLLHTGVLRNDNPDIKILLVNAFRQRTHNICQTACLYKRNTFRRCKKNLFHCKPSMISGQPLCPFMGIIPHYFRHGKCFFFNKQKTILCRKA